MHLLDDVALLLGRLFMAALFLPSGLQKATNLSGLTGMLERQGLPYPSTLAILAVIAEIAGPIALILGVASRLTAILLIGFVAVATLTAHAYWLVPDAAAQATQSIQFFKNLAIIGGLLFYFASGPGAISLERNAVHRS
ncbi:DoxX family protein [Xanthobacter pseudotagetidis]|uniref:DoxX family protein n=1 Tax=Xanthobacter pseudotagetidis TaxID=3119911 RepID=UPI0037273BB2